MKPRRRKFSNLVLPDPTIDVKYKSYSTNDIKNEIKKCANGIDGLKYFINEYIYVPNKIQPKILVEKPHQFKHLIFEGDKINLKLYAKQEEYVETLQDNRLVASYKSRQCIPKDSIIFTPEGEKKIQDLTTGDAIYSYNEESGKIEIDLVVNAQCSGLQNCESILYDNGKQTEQGQNHPFLLSNNQQKKSIELEYGDELRYFDYSCNFISMVKVLDIVPVGKKECQDIETYKNKNFIFDGFIVHNTGISTITQAYLLQYALFNDNKEVVIVSKSEKEAIKFLDAIYFMYNHLPFFLRRPYDKAITKSFNLGTKNNATKITVLTSTMKSGRSFSATLLVLDECVIGESMIDVIIDGINQKKSIKELYEMLYLANHNVKVKSFNGTDFIYNNIIEIKNTCEKKIYRYSSINNVYIECSEDHPILTKDGNYRPIKECFYLPHLHNKSIEFLPIIKIEYIGLRETYNIHVENDHVYIANDIVTHNCEFIDHVDTLQGAAQPTLSATGGQAILISTPQLYKSQFQGVCHDDDGYENAFKVFKIHWQDIPGRDKGDWYEAQCKELKYDRMKIMTELDMQWIIPYTKYFNDDWLKEENVIKKKNFIDYNIGYDLALIREVNPEIQYYFGIDTYEGGEDFNTGIVLGSDNRIYAYFKTKRSDIFDMVVGVCEMFNTKVNIEKNRGFQLIKEFIDKDVASEYLLYRIKKQKNTKEKIYGYNVGENRNVLLTYASEYLKSVCNFNSDSTSSENPILIPEDLMTEMRYFVFKKSKVEGLEHDDLIFALIAALFVRNNMGKFVNFLSKDQIQRKTGLERTSDFYKMINSNTRKKENLKNELTKNILARNMISDLYKDKQLTKEQLDVLESIL